jgi:hypothetical protein
MPSSHASLKVWLRAFLQWPTVLTLACSLSIASAIAPSVAGGEPQQESPPRPRDSLAARIDRLLTDQHPLLLAPRADEGQLLRRLSLDLRGVVPTQKELDAFVNDSRPARWHLWVQRFLSDPLCDEHLVQVLDRTLMLRRPHTLVDRAAWLGYLREQVAQRTPLNKLTAELLASSWWSTQPRAPQRFFLDRGGDPNLIARDLGRVFLGRDLQCAQCHDHPQIDDYRQTDYHGLLAFFAPSKLTEAKFNDAEGKEQTLQLYSEAPPQDAPFASVFNSSVPYRSGPRLPEQTELFEEYKFPEERLQAQLPSDAIPSAMLPPQQSRRQLLAEQLTQPTNRPFVANWANRWWALVFGEGLVHPVDMHHVDNPPAHPELYTLITDGLLELNMEPRSFLEQLVKTEAYQRADWTVLQRSTNSAVPRALSVEQRQTLRADSQARLSQHVDEQDSLSAAETQAMTAYETATTEWEEVQAQRAAVRAELDPVEAALVAEQKKEKDAAAALATARKRQNDTQAKIALLDEAGSKLQQAVALESTADAELLQAAELAKQRAAVAREGQAAIDQEVAAAQAAHDAALPTIGPATDKVREIVTRLQPIELSLLEADRKMLQARKQWHQAYWQLQHSKQQSERHLHTIRWLDQLDEISRLREQGQLLVEQLATLEDQQIQLVAAEQHALQQHQQLQLAEQAARQQLDAASKAIETHSANQARLQQSLDALAAASSLVSQPASLQTAQDAILAELQARSSQVGQLQAELGDRQTSLTTAVGLVEQSSQQQAAAKVQMQQFDQSLVVARQAVEENAIVIAAANDAANESWQAVAADNARNLATARLSPLSPEQLCWSILNVTGQLNTHIQIELAELEKQSPLPADADSTTRTARQVQAVRLAFDKLRGNADVWVSLYASGPDKTQDDFFASADQALYTANSGSVFVWAGPGVNVTQQALTMTDDQQVAQALYWSLLCRIPNAEEQLLVIEQLAGAGDQRAAVLQEMVWSLLASAEFRFSF